jgi:hypothetical protein
MSQTHPSPRRLRRNLLPALSAAGLLALGSACGGGAEQPKAEPVSTVVEPGDSEAVKAAKQAWPVCVSCHGANGMGDGAAAVAFPVKPRSFHDKAWQQSVDDAYIKKIVAEGGTAVGKNALMTGAPQLKGNEEALDYIVRIVRSFGR